MAKSKTTLTKNRAKEAKKEKLTSTSELIEQLYGKTGTSKRDNFEKEYQERFFGEIVKMIREQKELTQEELGSIVNMKKPQISRMERQKSVTISTAITVLSALGAQLKVHYKFKGKEQVIGL